MFNAEHVLAWGGGPSPALRDQTRSASNPSSGMEVEVELNGLAGELCCIMAPISSSLADLKLLWQAICVVF